MLGFGIGALRLNPRRPISQALATICFLSVLIFAAQLMAKHMGALFLLDHASNPLPWIRLKFGLIGLLSPFMVWVCYYLVSGRYSSPRNLLYKLTPWIGLSAFLFFFPFTEAFKPSDSLPGNIRYGPLYYLYFLPMLTGQLAVCVSAIVVAPRLSGLRKLELKFITIALGYLSFAAVLVETIYATWPQIPGIAGLTRAFSYLVYLVFGVSAWSVTSRRVYHSGQLALSIVERSLVITAICVLTAFALRLLVTQEPSPFAAAVVMAASFLLLSWCDDRLRSWLKLKEEQQATAVEAELHGASDTLFDPDRLTDRFEAILQRLAVGSSVEIWKLERGNLYIGRSASLPVETLRESGLFADGWVSTVALARSGKARKPRLHSLLEGAKLAVLVSPRWTTREPGVIIAFGERENELPYTHPEVRLLRELADVVDSLHTRARLTLQAQQAEQLGSIGRLGAIIAHELRNPISTLKSFSQMLPKRKGDDRFLSDFAEIIPKEAERIEALAEQLLDLSRPRKYNLQRGDLHKAIDETVALLRPRAEEDRIRIVTKFNATRADAMMDADAIRQVFINLLRNASEAVIQRDADRMVEIRTHAVANQLICEIEDNGPGLPKAIRGKLFDAFASQGKQAGIGLGLAICREIVRVHGGSITADLARESGCVFRISIPATTAG